MGGTNQTAPEPPTGAGEEIPLRKDYGQALAYDPHDQGPVKQRSCTDVLCLGLFLAFIGGWIFIAVVGIIEGDINKVLYPTDSNGYICGSGEMKGRDYLFFFDLTKCLNPAVLATGCGTPQVCVSECPSTPYSPWAAVKAGISSDIIKDKMKPFCKATVRAGEWSSKTAKQLINDEICPAWFLPSSPVLGRCLPFLPGTSNMTSVNASETMDGNPVTGEELNESIIRLRLLLELRNFGERVFSDLGDTWWMIGIALIGACILSFVWIILMRWITGIMVWTSITLCTLLFSGLLAYSVYSYVLLKDDPTAGGTILSISPSAYYLQDLAGQRNTWLAIAIVTGVILLVIVMVLIALRQRINIAIELIEQGSKAVGQMCSALTFPAMPFLLHIGVVAWFCVVAMSLSSAGYAEYRVFQEDKNVARSVFAPKVHEAGHDHGAVICPNFSCLNANGSTFHVGAVCDAEEFNSTCPNAAQCTPKVSCIFYKYVRSADATSWMPWYNLFGCYWASFFVSGLGELILAGVFARWYWTRNKNNVPNCSLCRSIYDAFRYHLGTVAFGSLIIAIIRFIRTIVSYVEKKLKLYNNDLTRCLLCCCKCCLYCLERFMRFISRNAYIMTAVKGTNFCSSAKDAFNLLMRNILRVLVLNKMVDFLLFMGKLVIVAGVGVLSYFFFSGNIKEFESVIPKLNYLFTPIVIIVIGSYWIASCFFGVYEMAVDTLFLCFLEDLERNDGSIEKPYFMSKGLQKVLHQMNKYHEDNN